MFEENNQENQNDAQENPPPQQIPKKIKKSTFSLLKENSKYIAPILLNYNISEENKKLEEMLSDLEIFRSQYKENQENNINLDQDDSTSTIPTKLLIYNSLEKHLIEISCIDKKEIRENRLNALYLWYKERNKINEDLRKINVKSYKEKDEIDEEEVWKEQEEVKNEENWENGENAEIDENKPKEEIKKPIFKKLNPRNEDLMNKKMLDEYQRKHLSQSRVDNRNKQKARNIEKSGQDENKQEKTTESATLARTVTGIPTQDFWVGDFSTFYSYKHGTNLSTLRNTYNIGNKTCYIDQAKGGEHENNFFPNYNKGTGLYFPPLNRETKFSYSYNRPQYNYNTMVVENNIKNSKMKILSEKRDQEEIKEHLDKFGMKRAKYKEDMNNKYELKSVINMYVNSNEFNSPLLEKYKIKNHSMQKDKTIYNSQNNNLYQTLNTPVKKFTIGVSSISQKNEDNKKIPPSSKEIEELEKVFDDNRIEMISPMGSEEEKDSTSPKRKKNRKSVTQKNVSNKKLFRGINDKIIINEVKNIDNNSKNILEQNKINKIKLKIKLPKEKIQSHLINTFQKKSEKISSDAISKLITNDSLFKEKNAYENLCKVNINNKLNEKTSIDNKSLYSISREDDEESGYHNFCLSMYDHGNLIKINDNNIKLNKYYGYNNLNRNNLKDSKLQLNKLHRTFHLFKDNLLNLRRTMSDWKKHEYTNLLNEIKKNNKKGTKERDRDRDDRENFAKNNNFGFRNKRIKKQNSLLNAMINPKDEFGYSRYFLPRSGSMLLSRIEEPKTKKKK